jgi:hypothetical protein
VFGRAQARVLVQNGKRRRISSEDLRKAISRRRKDWGASSKADNAPSSADGSAFQLADWRRRTSSLATFIIVRYQAGRNPLNGLYSGV